MMSLQEIKPYRDPALTEDDLYVQLKENKLQFIPREMIEYVSQKQIIKGILVRKAYYIWISNSIGSDCHWVKATLELWIGASGMTQTG